MDYKTMMTNQAKANGRTSLYPFTLGVIDSIISADCYDADAKISNITLAIVGMDEALCRVDAKKASAPTETIEENSHLDCTIDLSRVEPLVDKAWAEEILGSEEQAQ